MKKILFIMDYLASYVFIKMKKFITNKSLKIYYTVPYESMFIPFELAFSVIKLIIYKNIYNNINDLAKHVKKIISSERLKITLLKNFLEAL